MLSLEKCSRVKIEIFDFQGKVVRILKSDVEPAGTYRVSWNHRQNDGAKVSAGSYIVRVLVNGEPVSKCLYLVK